jgi:ABC-2 type transport system permease protein
MNRTRVLLNKELLEIRRSRGLLLSMFALPIPMVAVALVLVNLVMHAPATDLGELVRFYRVDLGSGDLRLAMAHFWVRECAGLFLVMPLFIPVLISAQSVAGEKERRTIEPLLASPLTAAEIVLAKSLAAVLPAMVITLIAFILFAVGVDIEAWPVAQQPLIPDRSWLFALLVLAPLLSFFGNTITVLVSSRVSDSRLAQQLAALIVIPLLGLTAVQFVGFVFLRAAFYVLLGVGLALADVALFAVAVRMFDRQRILSRWG